VAWRCYRHDSKALTESGIADRWANHLKPGMLADLGYLGAAAITGTRKPRTHLGMIGCRGRRHLTLDL
jgi:hypothetical protein